MMLYMPQSLKHCPKCGEWRLASTVGFHARKSRKFGLSPNCKNCENKASQARRSVNKEKYAVRTREYYQENKEKFSAKHKEYSRKNSNQIKARQQAYYAANTEKIKSKVREWSKDNKERAKQRRKAKQECNRKNQRAWRAKNKARLNEKKRMQYRQNSHETIERQREQYQKNKAVIAQRNKARYLAALDENRAKGRVRWANRHARLLMADGTHTTSDIQHQYDLQHGRCFYCGCDVGVKYHADHYIPLSKGGSNGAENIVIACPTCNMRKHDLMPDEFMARLENEKNRKDD